MFENKKVRDEEEKENNRKKIDCGETRSIRTCDSSQSKIVRIEDFQVVLKKVKKNKKNTCILYLPMLLSITVAKDIRHKAPWSSG